MTTPDEQVERVAKAIFELQQQWDEPFSYHSEFTWAGLVKERYVEARKFRSLARAAIAALRDEPPTRAERIQHVMDMLNDLGYSDHPVHATLDDDLGYAKGHGDDE